MSNATVIDTEMLSQDEEDIWFFATKEKLSPDDVLVGLLDHGLFAEKNPTLLHDKGVERLRFHLNGYAA
ncbi:hypothetical protein [Aeromonas veronii]|uniref:hypothetical protein n=1 Tax=Aeromonas veronii TaxID=654 RepID=UPI002444239D|nr:hypothetical protein [Aeromonas veronii]